MDILIAHPNLALSAHVLRDEDLLPQLDRLREIQTELQTKTTRSPEAERWDGYILALMLYSDFHVREARLRGLDTAWDLLLSSRETEPTRYRPQLAMPPWLTLEEERSEHRLALMARDPEWYGQWDWNDGEWD